jgi:2'-5' RNA ligase
MRTFIAVDLAPELKSGLQDLIRRLKGKGGEVKWAGVHGLHLTLKFLGEISAEEERKVEGVLRTVAARHAAFPLEIKGTGVFPPEAKNPRVLWTAIEAGEALAALQSDLELELEKAGFPREERPFRPHLTLGRVKGSRGLRDTMAELERHRETSFGRMTVSRVTFFQSTLRPTGAEYSVLAEAELRC